MGLFLRPRCVVFLKPTGRQFFQQQGAVFLKPGGLAYPLPVVLTTGHSRNEPKSPEG